jgi:hypothetical protein
MPSSIRRVLDELPTTLGDEYEQALQGIPKETWQHVRLFNLVVSKTWQRYMRLYHIPLSDAHTALARACLTVLM